MIVPFLSSFVAPSETSRQRRDASLVFVVSLILTGAAWNVCSIQQHRVAAARFDALTRERVAVIEGELAATAQLLGGAAAFLESDGRVDRRMWRRYIDKLHVEDNFPGVLGVGFAPRTEPGDLAPMVDEVHGEGYADFAVTPPGDRPIYFPVLYVEPSSGRSQRNFGTDMYAEPARRNAMDAARDSGEPRATAKIRLSENGDGRRNEGVLVFQPVYDTPRLPFDLDVRRQALRGVVYASLRVSDLMGRTTPQAGTYPLDIALYSGGEPGPAALMYASAPIDAKRTARFRHSVSIDVFGTPWTLVMSTNSLFDASVRTTSRWLLLGAGVIASLLLACAVHAGERRAQTGR